MSRTTATVNLPTEAHLPKFRQAFGPDVYLQTLCLVTNLGDIFVYLDQSVHLRNARSTWITISWVADSHPGSGSRTGTPSSVFGIGDPARFERQASASDTVGQPFAEALQLSRSLVDPL